MTQITFLFPPTMNSVPTLYNSLQTKLGGESCGWSVLYTAKSCRESRPWPDQSLKMKSLFGAAQQLDQNIFWLVSASSLSQGGNYCSRHEKTDV